MAHLQQDPANANKGTVRGLGMVERSLQQFGAGRSILASADGVILAGNKTYDRAIELGIPVQEIESDGHTLYVIKRTDLPYDDPRAKELAIADNRASETGLAWDADVLTALQEDTILSLDLLKAGWCTILFNAFLQQKVATQTVKGGNTDVLYAKGTLEKSKLLARVHPDVAKVVWRFNRWHHHVDYRLFKTNRLIKREDIEIPQGVNNYGMRLVSLTEAAD